MVSQGTYKLALSCLQKNLPHFSWRTAWIRLQEWPFRNTGTGFFIPFPAEIKVHSQTSLHPAGFCYTGASAHQCFANSSCHQCCFKSQSASHPALQLSSLSTVGLLTHPVPLSFCQLNKWLTSPPSSSAAQLFALLTSAR